MPLQSGARCLKNECLVEVRPSLSKSDSKAGLIVAQWNMTLSLQRGVCFENRRIAEVRRKFS